MDERGVGTVIRRMRFQRLELGRVIKIGRGKVSSAPSGQSAISEGQGSYRGCGTRGVRRPPVR